MLPADLRSAEAEALAAVQAALASQTRGLWSVEFRFEGLRILPVALRLLPGEQLVGAVSLPADAPGQLIAATRQGRLIRRPLDDLRLCHRGDLGDLAIDLNATAAPDDRLVSVCLAAPLLGLISSQGRHGRIAGTAISSDLSLDLSLREGETLQALVPLINGTMDSAE